MKTLLMFPDRNLDITLPVARNAEMLIQDLALAPLFQVMAAGDPLIDKVCRHALLSGGQNDLAVVQHRQAIWQDCLMYPQVIKDLYQQMAEVLTAQTSVLRSFLRSSPVLTLHTALDMMAIFLPALRRLRSTAQANEVRFLSRGFRAHFAMLQSVLSDHFFATAQEALNQLHRQRSLLISARLGVGNIGCDYVLHQADLRPTRWWQRWFGKQTDCHTFRVAERDESGQRVLSELSGRGLNQTANALAQSADHILAFFRQLQSELAFYIGALNLHAALQQRGMPCADPIVLPASGRLHEAQGLYDINLALRLGRRPVDNDLNAGQKSVVIITGANQGGKSVFLRSIGVAQLMLQAGLFVPARRFAANLCDGVFTHYKREEDGSLESGKLEEELRRMSDIVDQMGPNPLLLLNESFAATNEREGSEIARQITQAFLAHRIKLFYVTHQYDFAHRLYESQAQDVLFLRAQRQDSHVRTFKLLEQPPARTSYGEDLYRQIFG